MHALQMLLCKAHLLSSRTERAATAIVLARRQSRRVLQSVRAAKTSAGVNSNPSASKPRGMKLKGSCHCGAVSFEVESKTPQPFMHCYCTICRKTQGGGGYTINIMVCVYAQSLVKGTFCMNAFIWSLVCPDTGIASASSRAPAFYSIH